MMKRLSFLLGAIFAVALSPRVVVCNGQETNAPPNGTNCVSRFAYDIVKQAIVNKQQVIATYDGHVREMCPHVIGTKKGKQQGLFYQFGGTSSSGPLEPDGSRANWRCIPINGLSNVVVRDGEWHTAQDHSRGQTCVDIVDVEVAH
jgi:hypothetical protein